MWPRTANRGVQTGGEISGTVTTTVTHLPLSVTEKTSRKPSPVLMYCSLMAPNSSCPAVSRTGGVRTVTHVNTHRQNYVPRAQRRTTEPERLGHSKHTLVGPATVPGLMVNSWMHYLEFKHCFKVNIDLHFGVFVVIM